MNSRDKGKRGELLLANELKKYGFEARRGVQYCAANGDADVVGLPGIHIECKFVEKLNIWNAMQQAIVDARPDEIPAVFFKKSRKDFNVCIRLDDFIHLYKMAFGKGEE